MKPKLHRCYPGYLKRFASKLNMEQVLWCEVLRQQLVMLCGLSEAKAKANIVSRIESHLLIGDDSEGLKYLFEEKLEEQAWHIAFECGENGDKAAYFRLHRKSFGAEGEKYRRSRMNRWLNTKHMFRKCRTIQDVYFHYFQGPGPLSKKDFEYILEKGNEICSNLEYNKWSKW